MGIVPPPGAEFAQPRRAERLLTQRLLNHWIHKNALHSLKPCRELQQLRLLR
jgi:hypothetical protein